MAPAARNGPSLSGHLAMLAREARTYETLSDVVHALRAQGALPSDAPASTAGKMLDSIRVGATVARAFLGVTYGHERNSFGTRAYTAYLTRDAQGYTIRTRDTYVRSLGLGER